MLHLPRSKVEWSDFSWKDLEVRSFAFKLQQWQEGGQVCGDFQLPKRFTLSNLPTVTTGSKEVLTRAKNCREVLGDGLITLSPQE